MQGSGSSQPSLANLEEWRIALLELLLPWVGGSLALVPLMFALQLGVSAALPYWYMAVVGLLFVVGARHARKAPRALALAFTAALLTIIAERALVVGWAPGVVTCVLALEIFVGLLLGRFAPYVLILAIAGLFVIGGLRVQAHPLAADVPPHLVTSNWQNWLRVGIVVTSISGAAGLGLYRVERWLEGAEARLSAVVAALREELLRLGTTREQQSRREGVLREAQKLQTVAQLGQGFAHVFNNVLTVVRSALEEARQATNSAEVCAAAISIREVVATAARRSHDLLGLARPAGELPGDVRLLEALRNVEPKLRARLRDNVQLTLDVRHDGRIGIAERWLEQMLTNLVLNAEQAMPQGGRVTLRAELESLTQPRHGTFGTLPIGEYLVLRVSDDGPGMPDGVAEHAFDPFFTTRGRERHDGLGLTLVYDITRRIGGGAEIEAVARGASVALYLPVSQASSARPAHSAEDSAPSLDGAPPWKAQALQAICRVGAIGFGLAIATTELQQRVQHGTLQAHWSFGAPVVAALSWVGWAQSASYRARLGVFVSATLGGGLLFTARVGYMQGGGTVAICMAVLLSWILGTARLGGAVLVITAAGYAVGGWLHGTGRFVAPFEPMSLARPSNWFRVAISLSGMSLMSAAAVLHVVGAARKRVLALAALEAELKQARTRQRAAAEALVDLGVMAERASRIESLGRLTSMTAHDLNNSLMALSGWSETLLDPSCPLHGPDHLKALDEMERSTELAEALVARLELGRDIPRVSTSLDLGASTARAEGMLRALLRGQQNLTVLSEPDCGVAIDEAGYRRVLLNLVANARDAMSPHGQCTVRVTRSRGDVLVQVIDDGAGMDDATRTRLFEAFFTTKGEHGTGLGLHSVANIVEAVGGSVEVKSTLGAGTAFNLRLPHAPSADEASVGARQVERSKGLGHVLLAEDEPQVRALLTRSLERAGFSVIVVSDGDEALATIDRTPELDALCLDAVMPGVGTLELVRNFNAAAAKRPILLMSGYLPEQLESALLGTANVTFLHKPFAGSQLVDALRARLAARLP